MSHLLYAFSPVLDEQLDSCLVISNIWNYIWCKVSHLSMSLLFSVIFSYQPIFFYIVFMFLVYDNINLLFSILKITYLLHWSNQTSTYITFKNLFTHRQSWSSKFNKTCHNFSSALRELYLNKRDVNKDILYKLIWILHQIPRSQPCSWRFTFLKNWTFFYGDLKWSTFLLILIDSYYIEIKILHGSKNFSILT